MLNYLNIEKRHGRAQNTLTEADLKGAIGQVLPGISGDWNVAAIYFVRHGQTDYNAARRVQGIVDVPINGHGQSQAQRNGRVLNELISDTSQLDFVSSPLLRARQTMEIVREAMGLAPDAHRTDGRLQEIHFGDWAGMTMAEIAERDPENYARRQADLWNVPPPGGESIRELSARAVAWFESVTQDTVAVAHGGINRCLRAHFLKLSPEELVYLDVPQDKVLLIEQDNLRSSSPKGGSAYNLRSNSPKGGSAYKMTWL